MHMRRKADAEPKVTTAAPSKAAEILQLCLEQKQEDILRALRRFTADNYVAQGDVPRNAALEMLAEVAQHALTAAGTFDTSRPPLPWLLRIALNVVRHRYRDGQRRQHRETHFEEPSPDSRGGLSDGQFFDQMSAMSVPSPEVGFIDRNALNDAIVALSSTDQRIIRTTMEMDWDMKKVAEALDIKAGTARVRLHRAIPHLKEEYERQNRGGGDE